jgi:hypothetical protein
LWSLHAIGVLLACACALDASAAGRNGSFGAGITIVRSAAGTAQDGQVDGNNQGIIGTLMATPAYAGQTFTFSIVTPPTRGTVTLLDPASGSFSYLADKDFSRGVDSFTFHAVDNHGVTTNTATVYVLVRVSIGTREGEVTTPPNTPVTGTLFATPAYSGEVLTFSIVKDPDVGVFTLTDPHTGAFSYTPPNGFTGHVFVKFLVTDPTGQRSSNAIERVTVTALPATALGGSVTTLPNHAVSGSLAATAAFAGQKLTYRLVHQAVHGRVVITDLATGAFTYTPAKGYKGHDSFTFRVTDQNGTPSNTAVESITVHK